MYRNVKKTQVLKKAHLRPLPENQQTTTAVMYRIEAVVEDDIAKGGAAVCQVMYKSPGSTR